MDKFGCSTLFTLAAIFFPYICYPILAFGSAQYEDAYEDYDDWDEEYA